MPAPSAEIAYFFRHALLRVAAYELQLPGDRAVLRAHALSILQGGCDPPPHDFHVGDDAPESTHVHDAIALDLARHAAEANVADSPELRQMQAAYLFRAGEFAQRNYRNAEAAGIWLQLGGITSGKHQAMAQWRAGLCLHHSLESQKALRLLDESAQGFLAAGQPGMHATVLSTLGLVYRETGRGTEAEQAYTQSLAIQRRYGTRRDIGIAIANMATYLQQTGRYSEAQQMLEDALEIHREVGNRKAQCVALSNLSGIHLSAQDYASAEKAALDALAIHRDLGDLRGEGSALVNLSNVYAVTSRVALAEETANRALAIHHRVGNLRVEAATLGNLASLHDDAGRHQLAEATYLRAIDIERSIGNPHGEGIKLSNLASFYRSQKNDSQAVPTYLAAIAARLKAGDERGAVRSQLHLAAAYEDLGKPDLCDKQFEHAIATARRLGDQGLEGTTLCRQALLMLHRAAPDAAQQRWSQGVQCLRMADPAALARLSQEMHESCDAAGIVALRTD